MVDLGSLIAAEYYTRCIKKGVELQSSLRFNLEKYFFYNRKALRVLAFEYHRFCKKSVEIMKFTPI